MGAFLGTVTRNASSVAGKQINICATILSPAAGIAVDVPFFYINKNVGVIVAPILLGNQTNGYIYSYVNEFSDTIFQARVSGGIPANTEIYLNFNCFAVK